MVLILKIKLHASLQNMTSKILMSFMQWTNKTTTILFNKLLASLIKKVKLILNEINLDIDSVPDPYYGGENGFNKVYDMLDKACEKIMFNIE